MDPFIGQIEFFAFTYAPQDWMLCNGQLLQVNQNTALFSLLGNRFGGDGRTTFALPKIAPMKTETGVEIQAYIAVQGLYPPRS